jgi:hypothetical protein
VGSKLVSALSLGTYAIVYETHYGVLLIAFSAWPFILLARRRRWQPRYIGVTGFIVAASLAIAVVQGGTLSEVAKRQLVGLTRPGAPGSTADFALAEQHVSVRFPKSPIGITSFDGTEYSIFSSRLVREGGRFVAFLPLVTLLLLILRRYWGVLIGLVSMVAIAVPASVDFGAFNGESFRFMFFAGVTAAAVFGASVGLWLDWLARQGRVPVWSAVGVMGFLILTCSKPTQVVLREFWDVSQRGGEYFWSAEEWRVTGSLRTSVIRLMRVATKLRSRVNRESDF